MLIDLHTHTGWGSGDSHLDPSDMIEQARRWGMDGIAVTDHDFAWDPEKVEMLRRRHGFLVIAGAEMDTDAGHVLVFGLPGPRRWLRLPDAQPLRAEVDAAEGVMVLAHPFQDLTSIEPEAGDEEWQRLIEGRRWYLMDAIEVHNGRMGPQQTPWRPNWRGGWTCLRPAAAMLTASSSWHGRSRRLTTRSATSVTWWRR